MQQLSDLDFNNQSRVRNLPAPVNLDEPVRLSDLNSAVEGLTWKDSVRVAASTNVNLAAPGATLDGVTMAINDRFLAFSQSSNVQNGIYIWNGPAVPATRALDANSFVELEQATVTVEEGSSAGVTYRQTQVNGTVDTSPVIFTTFGTSAPPASEATPGLVKIATQTETDQGTLDNSAVTPQKLANWAQRKLKAVQVIGDASATSYTVTHNLNTRDLEVQVYRNSGAYDRVSVDTENTTLNAVTVKFAAAPAANAFRVVILG